MQRRDVLQFLGAAMFSPLLSPLTAEERWRTGARIHQGVPGPQAGAGLSAAHLALVSALADMLIPRTDTPGALDVEVPKFVDRLVAGWYPDQQRAEIVSGLDAIDARAAAQGGRPFTQLDEAGKAAVLTGLDRRGNPADGAETAWRRLRDAIVYGYATAQPIATLMSKAPIIPGRFDGCVPGRRCPVKAAQDTAYDAIVVGSGISGGWAAKELCERGLRTLVLEAGRSIDPATDYVEHVQAWELPFRGWGDRKALERDQPVQKNCYACDEWGSKFFVNDRENPYENDADKPFAWFRGRQVGGRSIMWGRQVYRWSDLDFEANARDGIGVDWPIRYRDIAPWYDHVERFIGVTGQKEGLAQLPDGQFLPPMELRCAERVVREKLFEKWKGERVLTIGRAAILTRDHNGRAACHYCGPCERGCITHSYFSSIGSTLPAAAATGRLTLRPNSVVHSVSYDEAGQRASGVRVIDAVTMQALEFRARVVFLCASTMESARLLLNSATPQFSTGLGNSSGQVGRNLMDHCYGAGASGQIPGMEDRTSYGRRPNGIYIPRFRNVKTKHPEFLRGYGFQGGGGRSGPSRPTSGFGPEFKAALFNNTPGPWGFSISGWGECLPREDNRIELHPARVDKWGIPALRVTCTFGPNERALLKDMQVTAAEMLEAAGARNIRTHDSNNPPGHCIHEMGTARMGRDPKTSVLNGHNQMWDAKNVFITDGACMASSANQNPSITYMALTARAAAYAVDALKRREL